MALFGKNKKAAEGKKDAVKKEAKKSEKKMPAAKAAKTPAPVVIESNMNGGGIDLSSVLLRPHVTEKATDLSEKNVYAFEIDKRANKMDVRQAVEKLYKVRPLKIAVMNESNKYSKNQKSGRMQVKKFGGKKALVYLKQGDKIEFV